MNRLVLQLSILLSFSSEAISQNYLVTPNSYSTNMLIHGGFAGMYVGPDFGVIGIVDHSNYKTSYTTAITYSQFLKPISGGIGIIAEYDQQTIGATNMKLSPTYNFVNRLSRRWTMGISSKFNIAQRSIDFVNYTPRMDHSTIEYPVLMDQWKGFEFSMNPGFMLYGRRIVFAYELGNLFGSRVQLSDSLDLRNALRHTLYSSYDLHLGKINLQPTVVAQYQPYEFVDQSKNKNFFHNLEYAGMFVMIKGTNWSITPGFRFDMNYRSMYSLQAGARINRIQLFYDFGISNTGRFSQHHQLSFNYQFSFKSRPPTFRTISCPSWGGGSVTTSSNNSSNSQVIAPKRFYPETIPALTEAENTSELKAGVLTAGEINDFSKWDSWMDLDSQIVSDGQNTWQINPVDRYSVRVRNKENRIVQNAKVQLKSVEGKVLWSSITDNTGRAELWHNIFGNDSSEVNSIEVAYDNLKQVIISPKLFQDGLNDVVIHAECSVSNQVDILFAVDATGSMGDEIEYLKVEILDIMESLTKGDDARDVRLGSLFYRCQGNSYVTRMTSFSTEYDSVANFIRKQNAAEGGTEAVELAIDESVNSFDWNEKANARLMFLILDESPGKIDSVISMYHEAIADAAKKGIRIIPLVSSGVGNYETNKSLEYLMRSTALATNGTYAFLTDHSGVGNKHTEPTTDSYDVEFMNDLIVRLVRQFSLITNCDETFQADILPADTMEINIIEHVVLHELDTNVQLAIDDSLWVEIDTLVTQDALEEVEPVITEVVKTIKYFPNPTTGSLTIINNDAIESLYLTDHNGKIIQRIELEGIETSIDLSSHPSGIYFLQYHTDKRNFVGKIILVN